MFALRNPDLKETPETEDNTPEVAAKTKCDSTEAVSENIAEVTVNEVDNRKEEKKNVDLNPECDNVKTDTETVTEITINGEVDNVEEENKNVNLEHEDESAKVVSENSREVTTNSKIDNAKKQTEKMVDLEPDLATEDEYWDLWEAVKVDDIETVGEIFYFCCGTDVF